HADLHPGNLAVLPGSVLAFMDFGMVGRLSPERRAQCLELIRGLLEHDSGRIVRAMLAMGVVPPGVDRQQLRHDVDRLRDRYYEVPFRELALNTILEDFLTLAFRHRLRLPAELTMLAKTLVTLEGVARELDPALNIAEVAAGFGRELVREQLQPEAIRRRLRRAWEEAAALAVGLPRNLHRLLDRLANESLHLELEHRGFSRALGQLDRIANRLSFAIVLLSFSIVMTGLVISSALV
ncbi:MAG: AarF/ABC1/UbiB kinase family protein, partial [Clostridia bacterium]|nr:AarF/ABC1/UbiB kinase family protein [Clostridia bacterium]